MALSSSIVNAETIDVLKTIFVRKGSCPPYISPDPILFSKALMYLQQLCNCF